MYVPSIHNKLLTYKNLKFLIYRETYVSKYLLNYLHKYSEEHSKTNIF